MAITGRIRILIADDFKELRVQIRQNLENAGDMELLGEATDLDEALGLARELQPDVIIMNDYLPPIDSAHAASYFHKQGVSSSILVISKTIEYYLIVRCFQYGVKGYMHEEELDERLVEAVRTVAQGSLYLSPHVRSVYPGGSG